MWFHEDTKPYSVENLLPAALSRPGGGALGSRLRWQMVALRATSYRILRKRLDPPFPSPIYNASRGKLRQQ